MATDHFKLVTVTATIFKADDTVLETGDAVARANGLDWFYTATHQNKFHDRR
jgi:hypothetical protein